MGDSETVVVESAAVMDYASGGYTGDIAQDGGYSVPSNSNDALQDVHMNTGLEAEAADGVLDVSENAVGVENTATESSQADMYDSSVNGVGEAGNVLSDVAVTGQQFADGSAMSVEGDRLWSIVRANSLDFNAWTDLIDETEKVAEDNILKIRKVYDAFLAEFPLCYGYWKKYADHEARLSSTDKVVEVYERAVQGVTYSVDIWLHYCIFYISTYADPDAVRRLFERGLAYVGSDYLSYPLWDRYIEYEYMQQEWGRLAVIYTRILENPNQQLDRYFNSFKELAGSRLLSELRTADEEAAALSNAGDGSNGQVNEGEVHPDEQSIKSASTGITEAEELQKYIAIREEMYKTAKEFDSKIIGFETAIRRPYFHVRPLNVAELENWHNYLDFIENEDDFNKVVKLYERCLIACANYPDYWMRYVLCMEARGSMELATNALVRATQLFVKRQPEIHLFAARFKEKNGDIAGARATYQLLHTEVSPGLLEAIIKHANMERRQGNMEDAFSLYEHAIAIEKGKEQSQALPMLYSQYSRFVHLVSGNAERARDILVEALEHIQLSKPLLEDLIFLESVQLLPKRIGYLDSLVEKFITASSDSLNNAHSFEKEELSSIFLEFLDLFGDLESVRKADERHAKLFLHQRSTSELKKRHAEDFLYSDRAKLAKTYSSVPSTAQSLMGAYPNAQNQWAATGYGLQPQAWPQVMQAQGQWTAAQTQQAAYTGYGANYTNQQAPTTVPPTAAHGAYPTTYPAQAYTQQTYAQPAAAATLAPTTQPGSVPQAYYGSYY